MSSLNLDDFSDLIERPDGGLRRDAEERRERLIVPPGALGRLDELAEWLSAAQATVPVTAISQPRVVLFAGDHGVASLNVSARPAGSAHQLVRAVLDGESPVAVLARRAGCRYGSWTPVWTAIRSCFLQRSYGTGCGAAAGVSTSRTR